MGHCRQPELPEVGNLSRLTVTVAVTTVTEVGSLRWQPEWAVTVTDTESSSRSPLSCGEPSSIKKAVGRGILWCGGGFSDRCNSSLSLAWQVNFKTRREASTDQFWKVDLSSR
jgi:hypothetical protein